MTLEQFKDKHRHTLLGFLGETWACRKDPTSDFGRLMDSHMRRVNQLLSEMYADLTKDTAKDRNGVTPRPGSLSPAVIKAEKV